MTEPNDIRDQAQALSLRLRLGLADLGDVEAWADETILGEDASPAELVDLCLARRAGLAPTLSRLQAIGGRASRPEHLFLALRDAEPGKLSDLAAEKLAGALQVILMGMEAERLMPARLQAGLGFPERFWQAQVHRDPTFERVAADFRDFLGSLDPRSATGAAPRRGSTSVSAVVVSYHTGPVLVECLKALEADAAIEEIVVVDNGNPDATRALLHAMAGRSAKVKVVGEGHNRGFAAGANLGVRAATGDRLLILNPDAILEPGSAAALEAARAGGIEPMIVGGRILGPDGREQRGGRRRRLTLGTAAGTFLGLSRWSRLHPAISNLNRHDEPAPEGPVVMGAVSGAFMYLSKAGFERLGGFDEGYFLHVEDLDLCRRAEADGGSVIYTPLASALHYGGTSDAPAVVVERHKAAGLARYFRKFAATPVEKAAAFLLGPAIAAVLIMRARLRR